MHQFAEICEVKGETKLGKRKDICPSCDEFSFKPCLERVAEFKRATLGMQGKKYYPVRKGARCGLYLTWKECEEVVKYFSGDEFKGFQNYSNALRIWSSKVILRQVEGSGV